VPGTLDALDVDRPDALEAIVDEATRIGFPLLVKASAGGGGRGMRRVASESALPAALAAGAAEARATFGDGSVYLEREIVGARHIEVQLLGDRQGTIVAIGERDCSIQRRHQKLLEEAPAPGLSPEERRDLHEMAVRIARSTRLENAVTAEFLFDAERRFWFLEVNTRLQVEHGVTELVADLDIVREQLFLAAGRPLSDQSRAAAAGAAMPARHALEIRISAEDPARDFAPAPGQIGRWEMPAGPGVRVDAAVQSGERIPPDYDPMIAKIIVVDADRPAAIARLGRALAETEITGVQTTLPFHRAVIGEPGFLEGAMTTDWVDEHWAERFLPLRAGALRTAILAAADAVIRAPGPVRGPADDGLTRATVRQGSRSASEWASAGRRAGVDRWPR
jgi:acetyl-CoA carboxylase biotin carboxylase subunit